MLSLSLLSLILTAGEPTWQTDYHQACQIAKKEKKDLFICFRDGDRTDEILRAPELREGLARHVCLRVPTDYKFEGKRLLDYPALTDMLGKPGFVVVSLHDEKLPFHYEVISAHPLVGSRYRWVPEYGTSQVKLILDLPRTCSLTQRSMIYAIQVHPERPQSVLCECHRSFMDHARRHSLRQASMRHQHHADIIAASNRFQAEAGIGIGGASEVVAESWGMVVGGENVLEASFSCIDAWRHSPGHWGAVSRNHRYFGYDIARGSNGTWYATGIFAD